MHGGRRTPSELGILSFEFWIVRQGALWIVQFWIDIVGGTAWSRTTQSEKSIDYYYLIEIEWYGYKPYLLPLSTCNLPYQFKTK